MTTNYQITIMKATVANKLIETVVEGKYKSVLNSIHSDKLLLDESVAAKIVIGCCKAICTSNDSNIEVEDLCNVLLTCINYIQFPEDKFHKPYLQSVYHITLYLLKQENFDSINKLNYLLIPTFINCLKNEELHIYDSICGIIFKAIVKLKSDIPEDSLVKMYTLSLKMFSQRITTMKFFNVAAAYFANANFTKLPIHLQSMCYTCVSDVFQQTTGTAVEVNCDIFKAIVETLQSIIINLLKKREFGKMKTVLSHGSKTFSSLFKEKEFLQLNDIVFGYSALICKLEDIDTSTFITSLRTCCKGLTYYSTKYGNTLALQTICNLIFSTFQELTECYKEVNSKVWNSCMLEESHVELCKFLRLVAGSFAQTKKQCQVCTKCNVKNNLLTAIYVILQMGGLLKLSLEKDASISKIIHSFVLKSLSKGCLYIRQLQDLQCKQWKHAWLRTRIILFNVVVTLYQMKNAECIAYGVFLINNILKLEHNNKVVMEPDVLCKTLQCISLQYYDMGEFKTAAIFAALEIVYCKDVEDMSFSHWVQIKFRSNDSLKQLTVTGVLEENANIIKQYFPDLKVKISKKVEIKILLHELGQYKLKWPSKIPMAAVFKQLHNIADLETVAKTLAQTWRDDPVENKEIAKYIPNIIKKLNDLKNVSLESNICLVLLYVMQYYIELEKLQFNIVEAFPETATSPKKSSENTSNESNFFSSYVNLDQYCRTSSHLNKAISLVKLCISDAAINYIGNYKLCNTFEEVAYEFDKHGDTLQALQAWFICLELSKLIDNKVYILKSTSYILKYSNMDSEITRILIESSNKVMSNLIPSSDSHILEVMCYYFLNRSIMFLRHDVIQESFQEYQQALKFFELIPNEAKDELLEIQLDFLDVQKLQLPCDGSGETHRSDLLTKFFSLSKRIGSYVKCNGGAKGIALLLDINNFVVQFYKRMRRSREVRCYCRSMLTFSQKLFLPIRMVYTLTHLIYADTISVRFDDSKIKLRALIDVLCLKQHKNKCIVNEHIELKELVEEFSKMELTSAPTNACASPIFDRDLLTLPEFVYHKIDCICFYCTSIEYKYLILEYFTLEALLRTYVNNSEAANCFEAALLFYKFTSTTKNQFESKLTQILKSYFLHDVQNSLLPSYGPLVMYYGNQLLRTNDIQKATLINTNLRNTLEPLKRQHAYLYNEAISQAIMILMHSCKKDTPKKVSQLSIREDNCIGFKTPENNKTKTVFNTSYSVKPKSPNARPIRIIKLNFSPTSTPVTNRKVPIVATKNVTPLRFELKDHPSPCVTYNQAKNKRCALKEVVNPDDSDNESVIPSSPNAYTPNAIKVASTLKARTQLLTNKLKKSNIKIIISKDENNCNVRKNLMNDLSAPETCENAKDTKKVTQIKKTNSKNNVPLQTVTRSRNVKKLI